MVGPGHGYPDRCGRWQQVESFLAVSASSMQTAFLVMREACRKLPVPQPRLETMFVVVFAVLGKL